MPSMRSRRTSPADSCASFQQEVSERSVCSHQPSQLGTGDEASGAGDALSRSWFCVSRTRRAASESGALSLLGSGGVVASVSSSERLLLALRCSASRLPSEGWEPTPVVGSAGDCKLE